MKKILPRILFIFFSVFMLISGNAALVLAQAYDVSTLTLEVKISPTNILATNGQHSVGYVGLMNNFGNLMKLTEDTAIRLESSDPTVASVPSEVTLAKNTEYAVFDIITNNKAGSAKIFASFEDKNDFDTVIVGDSYADLQNDLSLVINLPTNEMNVGSEMPFSLYLQNSNGEITQAPFDVPIRVDFEEELVQVDTSELTISKGNSYVWSTIKSKDKIGNAFLRATADKLSFDEAKEIRISSSLPSSLKVDIFPEKVPATLEREVDVVVSLLDSDGLPTFAQEDVKLQFFADDDSIGNQIDKSIKELQLDGIIKKGEFSYHLKQELDLTKIDQEVTIGATTKGLGVASDSFTTVEPMTTSNPKAENKTMVIYTLDKIPTKSKTVAVYQIGTLIDDEETDETTTTEEPKEDEELDPEEFMDRFQPLIINENYVSEGAEKKINLISSSDLLLKIGKTGGIDATSSHGTAIIETGQETGQVVLSSTIKGIGSASTLTEVINTLKQEKTMVFSPTGDNSILFDKTGRFDLFLISLDTKDRPTIVENPIRYLITPINEILTIEKERTYSHVVFQGNTIQAENQESITINAIPIGESADAKLEATNTYEKKPTAKLELSIPFGVLNTNGNEYIGTVQMTDFHGNPITAFDDQRVKFTPSELGLAEIPDSVVIPKGMSSANFVVKTKDNNGQFTLTANANGIVGDAAEIETKSVVTKLKISIGSVVEPIPVDQQTELKIYVDDEHANAMNGVTVKVISNDASVTPDTVTTSADGSATIQFNPKQSPKASLQILAYAQGFDEEQKTFDFAVASTSEDTKNEIPQWIIYTGVGAVAAIVAGMVFVLRKPKLQLEDDEELE
ncbi:MAG: hypothetical protein WAO91_07675 [Candidatus Nitrosotenuis sp.]